jgi:hypothetical protein
MRPVVLVPCYRSELTQDELISINQCRKIFKDYEVKVFLPERMALPSALDGLESVYFPACHFRSVQDYSRLMLDWDFYDRFKDFDYMLIYQMDAYVFRDELSSWCEKGFDYIGAPWGDAPFLKNKKLRKNLPLSVRSPFFANVIYKRDFRVGNGGLSLRCIATFRRFLQKHAKAAAKWSKNEDLFWSLAAPVFEKNFRIPAENEAMYFSLELSPQEYVVRMGGILPFGCHAWRKNNPEFWSSHIPFCMQTT